MELPLDDCQWLARIVPVLNRSAHNLNGALMRMSISPRANNPLARKYEVLNL